MGWRKEAKRRAALEAVKLVEDDFVVGLGSGTTVAYAIQELGRRTRKEGLRILGVPTSYQAALLASENGITLTTLNEHPELDMAIDGADQIDPELNLIKGGGGAITREKVVASAAKRYMIVADKTKLVEKLGISNHPVPLEVLPFALPLVASKIREAGGKPLLRKGRSKVGPLITDDGNFIVDANFGPITAPKELNSRLKSIPGVIETGLFIEMADLIYVGEPTVVHRLQREQQR